VQKPTEKPHTRLLFLLLRNMLNVVISDAKVMTSTTSSYTLNIS